MVRCNVFRVRVSQLGLGGDGAGSGVGGGTLPVFSGTLLVHCWTGTCSPSLCPSLPPMPGPKQKSVTELEKYFWNSVHKHHSLALLQGISRLSQFGQLSQWRSASSTSPTTARSATRPRLRAAHQQNRSLALSAPRGFQPKLAPSEVTSVLRNNEYTCSDLPAGPVKFFDTNTLQSNDPIEDSYASALTVGGGYLFGIFDGHGGAACGQVV